MGMIDEIRDESKKAGTNKRKIMYFRPDTKVRVRFLDDMDDAKKYTFHDSFERKINCLCQEELGRDCPYCGDDDLRTRAMYAWSVYDYESKEVKLLLSAVNNCSPVPGLLAIYDNFGTVTDRDIVITASGKGTDRSFACVHQDKSKFRNPNAKAYSESAMLKIITKAYPCDEYDDDDEMPAKSNKGKKDKFEKSMNAPEDDESDYEDMSAIELYKECVKREIECEKKKPQKYYIRLLEEYDKSEEDWGDDDEEGADEWEDD